MDDLFGFADMQQKTRKTNRPTREEVITKSSELYDKFDKYLTVSKEEYINGILKDYDSLQDATDEEFESHVEMMNIRNRMLLKNLDNIIAQELQKRKMIREAKEKRKLSNRIKTFFQRLLR